MRMILGTAAVVAVVAVGCTTDDGVEVVVDDPAAVLLAAADTVATSGRLEMTMTFEVPEIWIPDGIEGDVPLPGGGGPTKSTTRVEGVFDGEDVAMTVTSDDQGPFGGEPGASGPEEFRYVAGREYSSIPGWHAEAMGVSLPDGVRWVESTPLEMDGAPGSLRAAGPRSPADAAAVLREVQDPVELDPVDVDGVSHRRFEGSVRPWDAFGDDELFEEEDLGPEDFGVSQDVLDRMERIDAYRMDRTGERVTVLVAPDGALRRVTTETWSEIEEQYADCSMLFGAGGASTMTLDVFDLGAEVSIEAPDPATVVAEEKLWQAMDAGFEEEYGVADGFGFEGDDPFAAEPGEETFDTLLGPRTRDGLINAVEVGMDLLGLDETAIDAAGLDEMSNEELVGIIDGYIEANGGSVPEVLARDALESGEMDELFGGYDMFEGCPA